MAAMFLMSLALALSPPAPVPDPADTAFAAARRLDQRVATVSWRLVTSAAAANLCAEQTWQLGFAIHHLSQYARAAQPDAARAFALESGAPAVLAVAEGSPAAAAGLRPDDSILTADGAPLPAAPANASHAFAPTESMLTALEAAVADGAVRLVVRRSGHDAAAAATYNLVVRGVRGCTTRFQIVASDERNGSADGRYVQITSAGVAFADTDDGLAAALAHELAHNILRHRVRLNAAGVDRGLLAHFGRSARLFRRTELEADRYSMYLLDAAGFSLPAAIDYWERYARREGNLLPTTHPSWGARLAAMRAEAAAIARAKAGGHVPRPPAFDEPLT